MFFQLGPGGFKSLYIRTIRIKIEKKILGSRNMQEKLENTDSTPYNFGSHCEEKIAKISHITHMAALSIEV
jgi:hypothetical protein